MNYIEIEEAKGRPEPADGLHPREFIAAIARRAQTRNEAPGRSRLQTALPQAADPIRLPGAPGRTRTCDARFRKQGIGSVRGSQGLLSAPNLAEWGKAWLQKSVGKQRGKSFS